MQNKKNLWIVTELFYPDEISTAYIMKEIAEAMIDKYNVNVICGKPNMVDRIIETGLKKEVHVYRCGKSTTSDKNLFLRFWRMFILSVNLLYKVCTKVKRDDKVLMVTNPLLLLCLMSIVGRVKKMHIYLLVHDVFPENAYAAGLFKTQSSISYRILHRVFGVAYNSVNEFIVLGRDMKEVIKNKLKSSKPITIIENWADVINIFPKESCWGFLHPLDVNEKIVIQYAGNVGRVQGLQLFLECLMESRNDQLHFCIWGDGSARKELQQYVLNNNMTNVTFHGSYRRNQQCDVLNACHLALISLSDNMYGLGVPSKSYNIMAANKPILYIGEAKSEIALTLNENNIGFVVENNKTAIIRFLSQLDKSIFAKISNSARIVAEQKYSKEVIMNKFKSALQ